MAEPTQASLMQNAIIQSRALYMIKLIQDAIFNDDNFYNLVIRTAGEELRAMDRKDLYRFYMRGSTSVALYTTAGLEFPLKLESDIDMMVLVNPELTAVQFNTVRGLLFYRIIEVLLAFSETDKARYFAIEPDQRMFDEDEFADVVIERPNQRRIGIFSPYLDEDPLTKQLFHNTSMTIGKLSAFTLQVNNDTVYKAEDGSDKSLGIGVIKVIPRSFGGKFSIIDIAIPKLNFYKSQQPGISRLYYEWLSSSNNLFIPINVSETRNLKPSYSLRKPQKLGYDKYILKTEYLPNFSAFSVSIPVLAVKESEIDNQLALATTTKEEKKAKRKAIGNALVEKLAQLKVNTTIV